MKTTIIVGSVRNGRQSHKAAYYVANTLTKRGLETDIIDLAKEPLPVLGLESEYDSRSEKRIEAISARLADSDAFIFVTPEYHGSFSGVLKNALDHFWSEFQKKPVGVVAASAGKMAGINASTQLQHVILSMGAYPMPLKLLVPSVKSSFDDSFEAKNEKIVTSTGKFLDEFIWYADALYRKRYSRTASGEFAVNSRE